MKKTLITLFVIFCLFGASFFVYSNYININKEIKLSNSISKNIYPDSDKLNQNILFFQSNTNISDTKIKTTCKNEFKFLGENNNKYIFNLKLLDNKCENPSFYLEENGKKIKNSNFILNIIKKSDIFLEYVDYDNNNLSEIKKSIETEISRFSKYKNIKNKTLFNIKANRTYKELIYKKEILENIIKRRLLKYEVPVKGYKISEKLNEIPNAGRPYRSHYTDGIHHGWDIIAPKGTPVSSIDNGVIIRVVEDFDFEDIANMQKEGEISDTQKLRNLDILRGQQVWLKTSKGDVMFYSHLTTIYDNIYEGAFIKAGEEIGTVGSTGVPDRDYTNFHLHFPIMKNPYNLEKVGKYSYEDIMAWDWYLKGQTPDEIIKNQKDIFVKEAF